MECSRIGYDLLETFVILKFPFTVRVWLFCLCVPLCTTSVLGTHEGQKKAPDPLELGSLMAVSHHIDDGNPQEE